MPLKFENGKVFITTKTAGAGGAETDPVFLAQGFISGGKVGGQTAKGDTASGGNLTLSSTDHATKGKIILGTSAYDEVNNRLGLGIDTPTTRLHIAGSSANDFAQIDTAINFKQVAVPIAPSIAILASAGNIEVGNHWYAVTYVTPLGETNLGTQTSAQNFTGGNQQASITVPVSSDYRVTGRKIYRSTVNSQYNMKLVTTINDNTTTTYVDNIADASLTGIAAWYRPNTTSQFIRLNGSQAMFADTYMTMFGLSAGAALSAGGGFYNTLYGASAGLVMTTGQFNSCFGSSAGRNIITGNRNTIMGDYAGYGHTGSGAVLLGSYAGGLSVRDLSGCVFIGNGVGYYETGTNKLFIDNAGRTNEATARTSSLIYGQFNTTVASQILTVNGKQGINTGAPSGTLDIHGFGTTTGVCFQTADSGGTPKFTIQDNGVVINGNVNRLKGYTVGTLPAGTQGDTAFVTDALAPTFLATVVGGGAIVTPCFFNGTNWVGY